MDEKPKTPNKSAEKPAAKQPKEPKLFWKGEQRFIHTLYRADISEFKRNVSYKFMQPILESFPHIHHFHSHDRKGKPNKYTTRVGGHFHEVFTHDEKGNPYLDENGYACPKLGPAIRERKVKLRSGKMKMIIEPLSWEDEEKGTIVDRHTHNLRNLGSEEISPSKIRDIQENNKTQLKNMGIDSVPYQGMPKPNVDPSLVQES